MIHNEYALQKSVTDSHLSHPEIINSLAQLFRHSFQSLGRLGVLRHRRVALLSHGGDVFDIAGNVGGGSSLLLRGIGYVAHLVGRVDGLGMNLVELASRHRRKRQALLHLRHRLLHSTNHALRLTLDGSDLFADFRSRQAGPFGEFANLVGNHCKAAPLLAGPRRFDGRVQGQQVGLVGDFLDHVGDTADILRALLQRFDLLRRFSHRRSHRFDLAGNVVDQIIALLGQDDCLVRI